MSGADGQPEPAEPAAGFADSPPRTAAAPQADGAGRSPERVFAVLTAVQICERFAFYSMQVVVVLYMTTTLDFAESTAYSQLAGFTALLFVAPVLGGHLADRVVHPKVALGLGALLLIGGYVTLAALPAGALHAGLGLLIAGGGLFLPTMPSIVGGLYQRDADRERVLSLLFTAINIGAAIPPLALGWVVVTYGYRTCFWAAAVTMAVGGLIFCTVAPRLPPGEAASRAIGWPVLAGYTVGAVVLSLTLIRYETLTYATVLLSAAVLLVYILWRGAALPKGQRGRLLACLALTGFVMVYVVLDTQAVLSLMIFTEYNVNRDVSGWQIPTISFQTLNPAFVILLGPLLARLWPWLERRGRNPTIPAKFAAGSAILGGGFVALWAAVSVLADGSGRIAAGWLVVLYALGALGELLLAPIGMAMIVKLSPPRMTGLMMGSWYLSFAVASIVAGVVSRATIVESADHDPLTTSPVYAEVFGWLGLSAISAGLLILALRSRLNRLISEVE